MTAGDVGVPGNLKRAVARFCDWYQRGGPIGQDAVERYVLRVTVGEADDPHYGMFIGGGAIILATEYAHSEVHSRGLRDDFSLGLVTARAVWGMLRGDPRFCRSSPVSMSVDGDEFREFDVLLMAASSLERLFLGIRPFWGTGPAALKFSHIDSGPSRFLRNLVGILRGRPGRHATAENGYHSYRVDTISMLLDGTLNLDGELLKASRASGPVRISATGPLQFLRLK